MQNELNIVLINPEIPQNTGNVGRTCVGLGATLHLVGKLGFSLDGKEIRRAGLDYWPKLSLQLHADWESFLPTVPKDAELAYFSTHGKRVLWDCRFRKPLYLVFGCESSGFPPSFYSNFADQLIRIPVSDKIRSLNLATSVGVAAFEATRQFSLAS